ncbi:MAG TPA: MliC family protein [Allosphingosinicella sp.]|nr:MliC family protein [Allosphingosinicella sp.]
MRAFLSMGLAGFGLTGCAGGVDHHAQSPAGIPYSCGNGQGVRITYEGGGYYPRGTAELAYQGRLVRLAAMPPTYGLRYQEPGDARPALVWSARGEEAWLTELAADYSERELAHCTRLREPGAETLGEEAERAAHH